MLAEAPADKGEPNELKTVLIFSSFNSAFYFVILYMHILYNV